MNPRCKILIVDDNEDLCKCLEDILEAEGYRVSTLSSGEQAIASGKENKYDVVLMDLKLPGMNGVDVIKEMRKHSPLTTFILITAFAFDPQYTKTLQKNGFEIFYKPFDMNKFMKRLHIICKAEKQGAKK